LAQPLHRRLRTGLFYALRTAFRIAPMPEATRDKLRQRFLDRHSNLIPPGPKGQISEGTRVRRPYIRSDERAIGYVPYAKGELPDPLPATLVAFYLAQFHTIPENDEWWGKGFTEWRNVTRALPQFEGHRQPKLPGDLGFYDLRNPDVMREQARLAREYGIGAFCFYFYWFGAKTLLETPLRNWLADPSIDLQFCLCWANEKWTRTWDGRGDEILIDQKHSPDDDLAFIAHVAEYMRDPRYLRIDGKPMLLVYRPGLFPSMAATAARWRKWCLENDIGEIHLAYVQSFERPDPVSIGFDAAVEFPPNLSSPASITNRQHLINNGYSGQALDWRDLVSGSEPRTPPDYLVYPGVNPCWDNEARRPGKGRVYLYSSPRRYRDWLSATVQRASQHAPSQNLIFINAWNEWAEGAVLEPNSHLGYAWLEATRSALTLPMHDANSCENLGVVIHAWHIDILDDILAIFPPKKFYGRMIITTTPDKAASVESALSRHGIAAEIHLFENRGRDILPFLHVAHLLLEDGFDLVLKLHTKRSPHIHGGDDWRRELISGIASRDMLDLIKTKFGADSRLGMVTADGHLQPINDFIGANSDNIRRLSSLLGLPAFDGTQACFPAGSMFFARLAALRPILDGPLCPSDFEEEAAQIDGTTAHALERLFGLSVASAGFESRTPSQLSGNLVSTKRSYPFARQSN
jgi:lipopolysaccharide biosynthesis protein